MTAPRLLILSFSPIASDARVLKQVALFSEGYEVITCGYGPAPDGVVEHIEVPSDLRIWQYPRALVVARQYRRAYWTNAAISFAREKLADRAFDIVFADDADAVPLALDLRPGAGVHADLHEYSPRLHEEDWKFRWFVGPFYSWMTRRCVTRAMSWTTVSEGLAREYARVFGFDPVVVTNAAPYREVEPSAVHSPLRLVHSGAGLRNRHLDVTVAGVMTAERACTLDLYLTANDPAYLEELRAQAASSSGRIRIMDPVPYSELITTLQDYDVGVHVLPPVNFNNRWALPNKLFDYIQARLGVIVGPSPEMAGYVRDYDLGAVGEDYTAEALAAVLESTADHDVASWKASAARNSQRLSSEAEVVKWKDAVDRLAVLPRDVG